MEVISLVASLLTGAALEARQWVIDAARARVVWTEVPKPDTADPTALAVAAGVVEMLAARAGQAPPDWTAGVPPAPSAIYLVRAALKMPRLRRLCEEEGPEELRRRNVYAPPDFLTAA